MTPGFPDGVALRRCVVDVHGNAEVGEGRNKGDKNIQHLNTHYGKGDTAGQVAAR